MDLARQMIEQAAAAGAHAVKFQAYKAGKIASVHSPAYWDTRLEPTTSQFQLFSRYDRLEPDDYRELAGFCRRKEIDFLATPFDLDAVDFLADLVPAFKIASADITNLPLLRKTAAMGKPVILSTGASTLAEIETAVQELTRAGCRSLALLHCVLNYPTPLENAQLGMIDVLKRTFPDQVIGYSDHVVPDDFLSTLEAAMLLGAAILEKHFTHDKTLTGNDHYHAMDQHDLKRFIHKTAVYRTAFGDGCRHMDLEASARRHARRSIVAAKDIAKGQCLDETHLTVKRPGHGISPVLWDEILGRQAARNIREDDLLTWDMLDDIG
jgi:N-acetylneuraminate synthase